MYRSWCVKRDKLAGTLKQSPATRGYWTAVKAEWASLPLDEQTDRSICFTLSPNLPMGYQCSNLCFQSSQGYINLTTAAADAALSSAQAAVVLRSDDRQSVIVATAAVKGPGQHALVAFDADRSHHA